MTSKFEGFEYNSEAEIEDLELESPAPDNFELLSAYIDGELSPSKKRQVQDRLDRDPQFKQLYTNLLTLQGHIQHSVAPPSNKSIAEITTEVFKSIDSQRKWRQKLFWGGSALAATLVASVSGLVPGLTPLSIKMAEVNSPNVVSNSVMLAVAVDRPAIDIPKSVTGSFESNFMSNE